MCEGSMVTTEIGDLGTGQTKLRMKMAHCGKT